MVPRQRNARTTQTLRRSREPVLVSVLGLSDRTNHSPCCFIASKESYNCWEAHVTPLRWTQGRNGSVNLLALARGGTIISPLALSSFSLQLQTWTLVAYFFCSTCSFTSKSIRFRRYYRSTESCSSNVSCSPPPELTRSKPQQPSPPP